MGLPMRITYNEKDYVYYINNSSSITKSTTELQVIVNDETIDLVKNERKIWVQTGSGPVLDPELIQALGRSVSLRFRM
ncbi:MAG: hypothetical protein H7Y07_01525 [Pyrinomonadaceae bacterium]|nr:hypothetical protein [Sphingobacteriaceae bacterium]